MKKKEEKIEFNLKKMFYIIFIMVLISFIVFGLALIFYPVDHNMFFLWFIDIVGLVITICCFFIIHSLENNIKVTIK